HGAAAPPRSVMKARRFKPKPPVLPAERIAYLCEGRRLLRCGILVQLMSQITPASALKRTSRAFLDMSASCAISGLMQRSNPSVGGLRTKAWSGERSDYTPARRPQIAARHSTTRLSCAGRDPDHATSPQSKRGDQEKRQEDRKLEQGAAQEGIQKIDVGRIRYGWGFTRGGGCERCKQRHCVVDHVCRNGQNDPADGREDADPPTMRLHRDPKKRAEDARGHCVSSEPKERVSAAELQAIWRHSRLRVALRHVQRRLEPIEPDPDQGAVDNTVAHIVELGAQQPEDHKHSNQ